ncbi:uncharacterized protein [Arachis hypogaea]|uniref:uncharacterized protein n=1 Tax=Arachis hypogaea TaxID=3818 RepID=UPI003B210AC1
MTHVKKTNDSSNEYEPIFVLKHEALYEGLREYFMSLMPKEQVHTSVVSIHSMIFNQIKVRQYREQIYIVLLDIVEHMAWSTLIRRQTRPTGLILSSMPTIANFLTKGNLHRIHFYLSQFAMEGIGGCGLLM